MNRWVFLRHGESEANRGRVFSGHRDVALTAHGRRQAIAAGPKVAAMLEGRPLSAAWSSDLQRARETAVCALQAAEINLPLMEHPALRERCLGDWEGQAIDPIKASSAGQLLVSWEGRAPNGESLADVAKRAVNALASIQTEGCILLVGHGGLIRALLGLIDGTPLNEIGRVNIPNATPIARDLHANQWARIANALLG